MNTFGGSKFDGIQLTGKKVSRILKAINLIVFFEGGMMEKVEEL